METRANYALIGLFTLAVVAAAFGFVYWFSGSDSGQRRQPLRIVFSGSVSGLSKGSMVLFNGIRVGEVTNIQLLPEDPRRVVAITEVYRATPVRTDTRARLEVNMLSGGMIKRAALARALALDPEILFLDEPTSGLDPIGAGDFDELIATLQRTLGLTVFMVTHDLDSLYTVCDRIAALGDGQIIAAGPIETMLASDHPWVRSYFHGKRARAALAGGA